MAGDCCLSWQDVRNIAGSCIRPGGFLLTERALQFCSLPRGSHVADIGCGAGGTLDYLERNGLCDAVGLDYSATLLKEAIPRLASMQLVRGQAESLPFRNSFFDALFCECVLSVLDERMKALHESARVLREGGFLILSDVFAAKSTAPGRPEAHSHWLGAGEALEKDDLVGFLKESGFSLLLWEEHEILLKEFVATMILAGVRLSDLWNCSERSDGTKTGRRELSYFLLVARKGALQVVAGGGKDGR